MSKTQSQRLAYGEELVALGRENKDVVVLEADLGKSTMSYLFQQEFPERYFEMGIAEQNMLSTAAGLAVSGKIAFCNSFAVFAAGRPYDQIRQTISVGKLNVKVCGSSAGLSDFGDGSSHQAVEDIAIMSAIPNMTVLAPCDAEETRQCVRAAAEIQGPVYIRVLRNDLPDILPEGAEFHLGEPRVLRDGSDIVIFAHGVMVKKALDAASELDEAGISAQVVNICTMKPFPYEAVAALARGKKAVVTAEEHNYIGGLASQTALALRGSRICMDYVAIDDTFGQSAHSPEELLEFYGLTKEHIIRKVKELL
jgi:transketolase